MAEFGNRLLIGDTGGPTRDHYRTEPLAAAQLRVSADDTDIDVGALQIPAAGVAGPEFGAVEYVLAAPLVVSGHESDSRGVGARMVEIGGATRAAGRFADSPSGEIFTARVAGCFPEPAALLRLGAEPRDGHERQPVHEQHGRKTRINRRDLLGNNLQVEVAHAAAAVLLRQEAHGESQLVTFHVGAFQGLKGLLCVRLGIGAFDERLQNLDGELPGVAL